MMNTTLKLLVLGFLVLPAIVRLMIGFKIDIQKMTDTILIAMTAVGLILGTVWLLF